MTYIVSFGGIRIRVRDERGNATGPFTTLEDPIAKYVARDEGDVQLDVIVEMLDEELPPAGTPLFESGGLWKLSETADGYRIDCTVDGELYKVAFISRDYRHAVLKMVAGDYRISYPLEYPLDEVIVNALLAREGAVELHACGLVDRNGDGLLFAGNSGDGKTTTARLWQHDAAEILSDDRIIIRRENGGWWMYGTPWHGEAEICSASRAPLRRIFLLARGTANAVSRLSPAAAVARMLACTFPPFHDRDAIDSVVATLGAIARDVPVSRFAFVNDSSAVAYVRQSCEVAA